MLHGLLEKVDREAFCALIDKIRDSDMETMSVMVLRRLARQLNVIDYHILTKERLIFYIKVRQQANAGKILADERSHGEAAGSST